MFFLDQREKEPYSSVFWGRGRGDFLTEKSSFAAGVLAEIRITRTQLQFMSTV